MEHISFRENISKATVQFCGQSELHLELCNITRCVPHNRMKDVTCSVIYVFFSHFEIEILFVSNKNFLVQYCIQTLKIGYRAK